MTASTQVETGNRKTHRNDTIPLQQPANAESNLGDEDLDKQREEKKRKRSVEYLVPSAPQLASSLAEESLAHLAC